MARPVTLFTGQWADLPLEVLAEKAASWGYDGLELACWGDHFEVDKALKDDNYCKAKRELAEKARPAGVRDFDASGRPGGLRQHRRAAQGDSAAGCLGRRRPGGRPQARSPEASSRPPRPPRSSASRSSTALPAARSGNWFIRFRRCRRR